MSQYQNMRREQEKLYRQIQAFQFDDCEALFPFHGRLARENGLVGRLHGPGDLGVPPVRLSGPGGRPSSDTLRSGGSGLAPGTCCTRTPTGIAFARKYSDDRCSTGLRKAARTNEINSRTGTRRLAQATGVFLTRNAPGTSGPKPRCDLATTFTGSV